MKVFIAICLSIMFALVVSMAIANVSPEKMDTIVVYIDCDGNVDNHTIHDGDDDCIVYINDQLNDISDNGKC